MYDMQTAMAINAAVHVVVQWDKHDKFRCTDADRVLFTNGIEPDEVLIARTFLKVVSSDTSCSGEA